MRSFRQKNESMTISLSLFGSDVFLIKSNFLKDIMAAVFAIVFMAQSDSKIFIKSEMYRIKSELSREKLRNPEY